MKKILALLLALFMIATLVACSSNEDEGNSFDSLIVNDDDTFSNNNVGSFTYEVSADGHYEITGYFVNTSVEHELVIPSEIEDVLVTGIAADAFKSCTSITSVTIPDSVKYIGDFAFYDCDKLASVTIADTVESIGTGAFYGCDLITSIKLPAALTEISDELFWECPALSSVSFGNAVTVIGKGAFYNCDSLTEITVPASVTEVKEAAFYGCDALVSITVGENVKTVGDAAFSGISAEKVTFNTTKDAYFETYFETIYGANETDYPHYELNVK